MKISAILTAVVLTACTLGVTAASGQTVYTDLPTYQANTYTSRLFDFEGIAPHVAGGEADNPDLSPLTVTVTGGADSHYYVLDVLFRTPGDDLNGTADLVAGVASGSKPTVTINFGHFVSGFGTEFGFRNQQVFTNTFTVQLLNGATPVGSLYTSPPVATEFIGFTSNTPFDGVAFQTQSLDGSYQGFDNLRLEITPEPGALALLVGISLPGAGFLARRRRKALKAA